MAKIDELAALITGVSDQLAKAKGEIVAKIAALEAALSNTELPAEAQTAMDNLKAVAQSLDDIVPDGPTA